MNNVFWILADLGQIVVIFEPQYIIWLIFYIWEIKFLQKHKRKIFVWLVVLQTNSDLVHFWYLKVFWRKTILFWFFLLFMQLNWHLF